MSGKAEGPASGALGNSRRGRAKRAEPSPDNPAQFKAFIDTVRRLELGGPDNDRAFLDAVKQVLPPRLARRRGRHGSRT
ncbi:hypothetical protein HPQ64_01650 [Rhizobiales bacterium]|uniref:hypothetical protein n=1 Tax=Hongsoonwoonella zoysiae TaxID=2821844 RepID=UPI00155FC184|nr:hypothetical protein [Hongsoonwoonella zoysiae]NRG16389.1 hypothetical protein [Hongsoonwoonella zoysiae]